MSKRKEKIMEIVQYLKENEDIAVDCLTELDDYNGYLGDDRYFPMEELEEMVYGMDPIDILNRAFFGCDADSWNDVASFNPNRDYFSFNAYGNLVSTNHIDYSHMIDGYLIDELSDHRVWVNTIDNDPELCQLFDELESIEG